MMSINYLSVIVALLGYTLLGMLWYGPFFGKKWMILAGLTEEDMKNPAKKKAQTLGYIASLISGFVTLFALAVLMKALDLSGMFTGFLLGAAVGFSFTATTLVGEAAWHSRPWALVFLNASYRVLGLGLGGILLGLW